MEIAPTVADTTPDNVSIRQIGALSKEEWRVKMNEYLIAVEPSSASPLAVAVRELPGKPLHPSCCIARWSGTADTLCRKLRSAVPGHFAVCSLGGSDWSYQ
jgi:hypothetical protein